MGGRVGGGGGGDENHPLRGCTQNSRFDSSGCPDRFIIRGMEGPKMSASKSPIERP